jgi:uncharacterized protein DUF4150
MGVTVIVNERTVVHPDSGGMAIAGPPDVCKTPTPGGPVPIPYPNVALSIDTAEGSKTVTCDGNSIMLKGSVFSKSTGDEAGTAGGGVVSGVIKGKATFSNYSFDVKFEGRNVPRLADPMLNNGNQYNAITTAAKNNPLFAEAIDIMCKEMCAVFKELGGKLKPGQQYTRVLAERLKNNTVLKKMGLMFEQRVWSVVRKGTAAQWGRNALKASTLRRAGSALGKKMLGEGVEKVGTKLVTKVGSKFIPVIGWAMLAMDVYDVISFIPDVIQIVEAEGGSGLINQTFDFKFPHDAPGPGQYQLAKEATNGDKKVIELTIQNCDC